MKRFFLCLVLVGLIVLPVHFGHSDVDETLVIYLSFDEGNGKEAKDQSMYGNHAQIISNTEWVDGIYGKAVEVTGQSVDCVKVPPADSLKITGEITMMV